MIDYKNSYNLILTLIPQLERDVVKNRKVILVLSDFIDRLNVSTLGENASGSLEIMDVEKIHFPYYSFGSVKSYFHLEYRELVLFAIYRKILSKYARFVDVGGNLGLHSIVVGKFSSCEVHYIEPDPIHYLEASKRFVLNNLGQRVVMHNAAASNFDGEASFVRVVGNTTGSHIVGSKTNVYGPTETFEVQVSKLSNFVADAGRTLAKLDIEGAEVNALKDLSSNAWEKFDCVVEITDTNSAEGILELAKSKNLRLFSQKISWEIASKLEDLPHRWDEGSVLISKTLNRQDFLS
jgi:FkbM family methyltransferase